MEHEGLLSHMTCLIPLCWFLCSVWSRARPPHTLDSSALVGPVFFLFPPHVSISLDSLSIDPYCMRPSQLAWFLSSIDSLIFCLSYFNIKMAINSTIQINNAEGRGTDVKDQGILSKSSIKWDPHYLLTYTSPHTDQIPWRSRRKRDQEKRRWESKGNGRSGEETSATYWRRSRMRWPC